MKTILLSIVSMGIVSAIAAAVPDATWTNGVANTPATAYSWSEAGNWQDGIVGGEGDYVRLEPAARVYVKKDFPEAPVWISGNGKAIVLGDVTVRQTHAHRAELGNAGYIYGNVTYDIPYTSDGNTRLCYVNADMNFCGRVIHSGNSDCRIALSSGSANFRFDRYADAAGETRTDDLDDLDYLAIGNGTITFYAPDGADAAQGTWTLTEGSAYATRVPGTASHGLAAGTAVASEGYLDDGVYLKRVFDDATIELSAPAKASGEATLSFAAFTPDFTATFKNTFYFQGGNPALKAVKKREADSARIVFKELNSSYNQAMPIFGIDDASVIPGTLVIRKFAGSWAKSVAALRNVHIELADNASASADFPFLIGAASYTARFTVTNALSSTIAKITALKGTLVKDGAGRLSIGLDAASSAGAIRVEGGTLEVLKNAAAGDGTFYVKSIHLAAGTTLVVPAEGLHTSSLEIAGEATISGGRVEVDAPGEASDGALVLSRPEGEVVGHPAFWVDASKASSLVYETDEDTGVNYVTRWNDCRDGEPMFCTNIVQRPTFTNGTEMAGKYVRIARYPDATDYRDTEQLVWSEPIRGIKAVFLVQDPTEGGGTILGRCSWRLPNDLYNTWGGPFYRDNYYTTGRQLVEDSGNTMPAVRYGRFFLNGVEVNGATTGYLGKYMQLVEFHANTNYAASTGVVDCDAFGGGYFNGQAQVRQCNGCMRIAECIIYTNTLSHAERTRVAQYLTRKWLGKDARRTIASKANVYGTESILQDGVSLNVPDGRTVALETVTNGVLTKSGAGSLYINGLDGASLHVDAGDALLAANTRMRYVPNDAWIHVDAQDYGSLTEKSGGELDKWYDVYGNGASLRSDGFTAKAKVVQNAINGHPAVDIGPVNNSSLSAALVYYDENGAVSKNYTALPEPYQNYPYMAAPLIKTAFAVYNSESGGGCIFGGRGNGYPSKGLPHRHASGDDSPIIDVAPDHYAGHKVDAISNALAAGSATFKRNGVDTDPFRATFLKGDERVAFAYSTGRRMASLGVYGQSGEYRGGLKYGAVIMYERMLPAAEIASVDAYLAKRWFDIDTPGYGSAAEDVFVAGGASLTVLGTDFSATSLGGGGSVTGDVTLESGGGLVAVVNPDGTIGGLTVDGAVKLSGGTVTLMGETGNIVPGVYPILQARTLAVGEGSWTLPGGSRYVFNLSFADDAAYLKVDLHGMRLMFR